MGQKQGWINYAKGEAASQAQPPKNQSYRHISKYRVGFGKIICHVQKQTRSALQAQNCLLRPWTENVTYGTHAIILWTRLERNVLNYSLNVLECVCYIDQKDKSPFFIVCQSLANLYSKIAPLCTGQFRTDILSAKKNNIFY